MPFVPATNVVQAEMIFRWDSQIVENVLHYQVAGGVDLAAMNFIGADLTSWWDVSMQPLIPSTVSLQEVRLTDLTSEFAPGASWIGGLPLSGTLAGNSLPNNVALSITKRSNFRGRAYRGRIYHIGLAEAQVVANQVDASHVTALLSAYSIIRELDFAGTNIPMVIVSRYQGGVARGAALVTLVSGFSCDGILDSQRRRLPRRGT